MGFAAVFKSVGKTVAPAEKPMACLPCLDLQSANHLDILRDQVAI